MTNPLVYQPPMTNPYQVPTGPQSFPFQALTNQPPLRKRYTPEQIRLYFFPFPDRGPKIRELQQKRLKLYQQIGLLALVGLVIIVLLIASAGQGISYLGLTEFAGIIGVIVLIVQLVRNKLLPLNEELRREIADDIREKEYTRTLQPPNVHEYDQWVSEIGDDIYENAPTRLHLHEHPEYKAWKKAGNSEQYMLRSEVPEQYGASLRLEGRSDEKDELPPQLQKRTRNERVRARHYSVYVFTALFIAEDYIAIYTNTVNLRDSTRDREEFEYCYHQHLSHMLLNVDTTSQETDIPQEGQIEVKESNLSLTFDSGRTIRRNITSLHEGSLSITRIGDIHEKLTRALIDHERSMVRSIREAGNVE